jgi:hypothetical protein
MTTSEYLLAGQVSELERLKLQSRVWEPSSRRLLEQIGDGRGARAVDIGCGVMGWLRVLSEWVGPDGQVVARTSTMPCSPSPTSLWPRKVLETSSS